MKMRQAAVAAMAIAVSTASSADVLLSEGFDNVAGLTGAGWVIQNLSTAGGESSWFQGNTGIFPAHAGPADSYAAANFLNAPFGGTISNWLMTPELSLATATTLDMQVRVAGQQILDTIEVYYSTSGASTLIGDFSLLGSYSSLDDQGWVNLLLNVGPTGGTGRFAVRYFVGDTSVDGNYIGIDSLLVTSATATVPTPGSLALAGLALVALGASRRRNA